MLCRNLPPGLEARGPEKHPGPVGFSPRVNSGAYRRAWQGGLGVNKGPKGSQTWYPLVWRLLNPFLILVCPNSNLLEGFWALVFSTTSSVFFRSYLFYFV